MKEMLTTLNSINNRLTAIETTLDKEEKKWIKLKKYLNIQ
jgi:hypothetical protein